MTATITYTELLTLPVTADRVVVVVAALAAGSAALISATTQ